MIHVMYSSLKVILRFNPGTCNNIRSKRVRSDDSRRRARRVSTLFVLSPARDQTVRDQA